MVWLLPPRTYVIEAVSPGLCALTAAISALTVAIFLPSTAVMTSPPVG